MAPLDSEVIVVGGGPAGAILAEVLARAGAAVLVLEQSSLPRPKPCGGGLSEKALALLSRDLDPVIEDRCSQVRGSWQGTSPFSHREDRTIVATVRREAFDLALLEAARRRGAEVREGVKVREVRVSSSEVEAVTSAGSFWAKWIAGADGWNSVVARSLNLRRRKRLGRALLAEILPRDSADLDRFRGAVTFDFGMVPFGYGWVFPKRDHLNVGLYTLEITRPDLRARFANYLRFRFPHHSAAELAQVQPFNAVLPLGGRRETLHWGRAVLLGDAAGLVDPTTGEGIYSALRSGRLAAESLLEARAADSARPLVEYSRRVHREMLGNFRASWMVSQLFYRAPGFCYQLLTQPRVVAGYQKVKARYSRRGETPYLRLLREFLTTGFFHRR